MGSATYQSVIRQITLPLKRMSRIPLSGWGFGNQRNCRKNRLCQTLLSPFSGATFPPQ